MPRRRNRRAARVADVAGGPGPGTASAMVARRYPTGRARLHSIPVALRRFGGRGRAHRGAAGGGASRAGPALRRQSRRHRRDGELTRRPGSGAPKSWPPATPPPRPSADPGSCPAYGEAPWELLVGVGGDPDTVVDAFGVDGFSGSPLAECLAGLEVDHLLVCGLGLEGPVHSTLRSANDRGLECLLVIDACAPLDRVPGGGGGSHHRDVGRDFRGGRRQRGRVGRARPTQEVPDVRSGSGGAVSLAVRRRVRSGPHRGHQHRLAGRLLRPGRLRRRHGLRPETHPSRPRAHRPGAGGGPGRRACT